MNEILLLAKVAIEADKQMREASMSTFSHMEGESVEEGVDFNSVLVHNGVVGMRQNQLEKKCGRKLEQLSDTDFGAMSSTVRRMYTDVNGSEDSKAQILKQKKKSRFAENLYEICSGTQTQSVNKSYRRHRRDEESSEEIVYCRWQWPHVSALHLCVAQLQRLKRLERQQVNGGRGPIYALFSAPIADRNGIVCSDTIMHGKQSINDRVDHSNRAHNTPPANKKDFWNPYLRDQQICWPGLGLG